MRSDIARTSIILEDTFCLGDPVRPTIHHPQDSREITAIEDSGLEGHGGGFEEMVTSPLGD
jgi:hypothetical protein